MPRNKVLNQGEYEARQTEDGAYRVTKSGKHVGFVMRRGNLWQAYRATGKCSFPSGAPGKALMSTVTRRL